MECEWGSGLARHIAVLEDDQRRIDAMRAAASVVLVDFLFIRFCVAGELLGWLNRPWTEVAVLSLDCDLDSMVVSGQDSGSGEEVVAELCRMPITFPVIIHSSNAFRAPAMHLELAVAGWSCVRLSPYRDGMAWAKEVRQLIN